MRSPVTTCALLAVLLAPGCAPDGIPARAAESGEAAPALRLPAAAALNLRYRMRARVDPGQRSVGGTVTIWLRNHSARPLTRVPLHLYLNAFSAPETLFLRRGRGRMRGSAVDPARRGWIRVSEALRRDEGGETPLSRRRLHDGTVLELGLDRALPPGASLELRLHFEARLPNIFARTGVERGFLMLAQWYPKPGVLRPDGSWHCPPYHPLAEYFADFADFELELRAPAAYHVASSGQVERRQRAENGAQRLVIRARAVHDLAVVLAAEALVTRQRRGRLTVEFVSVPGRQGQQGRLSRVVWGGLDLLGRWLAPYPYPTLTVVDVPARAKGAAAMEYPTLFTVSLPWWSPAGLHSHDITTLHELTHQYFQGIVASNEPAHPWMDEAVTTYVSSALADALFGPERSAGALGEFGLGVFSAMRLRLQDGEPPRPVGLAARGYRDWSELGRNVYVRGALLLRTVESLVGRPALLRALRRHVQQHAFAHPGEGALLRALVQSGADPAARKTLRRLLRGALQRGDTVSYGLECLPDGVRVRRRGAIALPLRLTLERAGAPPRTVSLAGQKRTRWIPAPGLRAARLGPSGRLALDPDALDDACQLRPGPISPGVARWTALWQLLLQVVGP